MDFRMHIHSKIVYSFIHAVIIAFIHSFNGIHNFFNMCWYVFVHHLGSIPSTLQKIDTHTLQNYIKYCKKEENDVWSLLLELEAQKLIDHYWKPMCCNISHFCILLTLHLNFLFFLDKLSWKVFLKDRNTTLWFYFFLIH